MFLRRLFIANVSVEFSNYLPRAIHYCTSALLQRAYGTVRLKVGRIKSLNASLQLDASVFSFTNLGLEDEKGKKETVLWMTWCYIILLLPTGA